MLIWQSKINAISLKFILDFQNMSPYPVKNVKKDNINSKFPEHFGYFWDLSYNKLIEFEWNYALKFVVFMAGDNWHPLIW